MTEKKSLDLAGARPSSEQLKRGLRIFYKHITEVLRSERQDAQSFESNRDASIAAIQECDESTFSQAADQPDEINLTKEAGLHGTELIKLGYTLSHVVHAYGAMCQSIAELATRKHVSITATEFHDLNQYFAPIDSKRDSRF